MMTEQLHRVLYLLSFVPSDDVTQANLPKSSEECKSSEEQRSKHRLPIVKVVDKSSLLDGLLDAYRKHVSGFHLHTSWACFFMSSGWGC